jgi:hypothetical protein
MTRKNGGAPLRPEPQAAPAAAVQVGPLPTAWGVRRVEVGRDPGVLITFQTPQGASFFFMPAPDAAAMAAQITEAATGLVLPGPEGF